MPPAIVKSFIEPRFKLDYTKGQVQLKRAVLCVDCEVITEHNTSQCPVCNSSSLLFLARILNRKT